MKSKTLIVVCVAILMAVGCKKAPTPAPPATPLPTLPAPEAQTVTQSPLDKGVIDESALGGDTFSAKSVDDLNKEQVLTDVYFDFDKSSLTPATRNALAEHAKWLQEHNNVKILIEGHCDERGTEQYNMALGDRRANSVKNYLVSLGVSSDRMRTISYGEMYPKVEGHGEWAWSQNRRCHFVIKEK